MNNDLDELIAIARGISMTPNEEREQRQSFAYGNTHIENEFITREMIKRADEAIEQAD